MEETRGAEQQDLHPAISFDRTSGGPSILRR
jgi:hypothetical protein